MSIYEPGTLKEIQSWVSSRIESQDLFRICGNCSRNLTPVSGNSDTIPSDILSLKNLNKTRFFDPDDMVVGVEAGMSIRTLQKMLGERNMLLPVNPWYSDSCVGSVAACNDFGPNRMFMGGLRDYIIGIEYINGKGEIVTAGGKVVKNVSGYDLTRMMLGSQGGLGVITALNFKVLPHPVDPHGMFGIFQNEEWLVQVKELLKRRLPLDWIQAASIHDSSWSLGLGYSGNLSKRNRIESEISDVFGESMGILPDGKSFSEQKFTPGEQRFEGYLKEARAAAGLKENCFHVFATLPTEEIMSFPFETFRKEKFKMVVHPAGGDIHFMHKSTQGKEQLKHLEKIKTFLSHPDSKLRWVSSGREGTFQALGKFGVANGYKLSKRLKQHLDPSNVFFSPYYDLDFDL